MAGGGNAALVRRRMVAAVSIDIPTRNEEEFIEVLLSELPHESEEIVEILRSERPPLETWRRFAVEYYHRGILPAAENILNTAIEQTYTYDKAARDRVAVLDALAAFHIARGAAEKDPARQAEHFSKATMRINAAEDLDPRELNTWLVKALLLFTRGDFTRANTQFMSVLSKAPDNIPALLGKASIEFGNGDYVAAVRLFKRALRILPEDTAQIRLGIGLCYHQLNKDEKARQAYRRCLDMDPDNVQALVGLGMLDMNSRDADKIVQGLQTLRKAYQIDQFHPLVLNQLAYHFFVKRDHVKTEALAKNGYFYSKIEAVQAESCLILARSYHQREEYENAFSYYFQAVKLAPTLSPAQYGLGQMFIHRGETEQAIECFEKVLAANPDNYETQKILGSLYGHVPGRRAKAIELLRRVVELRPDDVEAWIELAEYLESANLAESLKAYDRAVSLLKATDDAIVPPDLLNNLGALSQQLGKHADALKYYEEATEACRRLVAAGSDAESFKGLLLTMKYNRARLFEAEHRVDEAVMLYKEIVAEQSKYLDAHLRLGMIAMEQRDNVAAMDYLKEALHLAPAHPDVMTVMAQSHVSFSELIPAKKNYERVLSTKPAYSMLNISSDRGAAAAAQSSEDTGSGGVTFGGGHDIYSLVALGSVCHRMSKHESDPKKQTELQKRAFEVYAKALYLNKRNPFAANGIAVLLAERGHFAAAREIFLQVRDAIPDNADVWINLAHVNFELDMFADAIKIYESALRKLLHNNDVATMLYLARAHYHHGKRGKDVASIETARHYLERALFLRGWDMSIRFNLALVQQELAALVSAVPTMRRTIDQVLEAQHAVARSIKTFEFLAKATPYPPKSYEPRMAKQRLDYCRELVPWLEKQRQQQEQSDSERRALIKQLEDQRKQLELEQLENAKREDEEAMKRNDEARRLNEQLREELQRRIAESRQQAAEKSERSAQRAARTTSEATEDGKRRRSTKGATSKDKGKQKAVQDDEVDEPDAEEKAVKRARRTAPESAPPAADSSGDEVPFDERPTPRPAAKRAPVSTSGGSGGAGSGARGAGGRLKKRTARQMEDEIDEDDENFAVAALTTTQPAAADDADADGTAADDDDGDADASAEPDAPPAEPEMDGPPAQPSSDAE